MKSRDVNGRFTRALATRALATRALATRALATRPLAARALAGGLRRTAGLGVLALAVLAGLAVVAPGAAQAQSRFEGRWNGTWNEPATHEDGSIGIGIAYDGDLRGRMDNPGKGFSGDLTGRIDESGHIDGIYTYSDHGRSRTFRATGSVDLSGEEGFGLYGGIAFFDGPTRVGGAILTLDYLTGPRRRYGR